jgi:sigma-E factor negative regulatory protein RseB
VTRLPAGFHLSGAKLSLLAGSEYPVQHLVYTDGLATVSVFIAHPKSEFTMPDGFSSSGSLNAYSLTIDGRLATALGEVPRRTVYRIANSLNAR